MSEVEPECAVEDAVLLVFVLANREMKLVVSQVRGSTPPHPAGFLLPSRWSHRHPKHPTVPPGLGWPRREARASPQPADIPAHKISGSICNCHRCAGAPLMNRDHG